MIHSDALTPALHSVLPEGVDLVLADFTRGLPPVVVDWFLHSQDPRAVAQRTQVRQLAAAHIDAAKKRQVRRFEGMKEEAKYLDPKADVRPIASIDPVIAQDYRNRYGSGCLNDREFLEDCRKTAPELFYPVRRETGRVSLAGLDWDSKGLPHYRWKRIYK